MTLQTTKQVELVIAGFGGQGVLTIGLLLAKAGLNSFQNVTWFPTYETFMRGGTVACYVVLSNEEIASPLISDPEAMIICDRRSLDTYESTLVSDGLLIYDCSLIDRPVKRKDLQVIPLPATELAQKAGSPRVANLVLLGAYLALTGIIPLEPVDATLSQTLEEESKGDMVELNRCALHFGFEHVSATGS